MTPAPATIEVTREDGAAREAKLRYRNSADAFLSALDAIVSSGDSMDVRGSRTREIRMQTLTMENPLDRCITVAHRNNNVFASIAETVWVLAGRDDIGFLVPYLPRAVEYSDDGTTWRGAYGPRLRDWNGTDQIAEVLEILDTDPTSRRAVLSIFDPARDFTHSRDIPCTNWLHAMVRDGAVHLEVVMRSNDIMWGFSGINTFEWSVLLEMLAEWLNVDVGTLTFYVSSLHLYERHDARAELILARPRPTTWPTSLRQFATSFSDFPDLLHQWFSVEERIRRQPTELGASDHIADPLFKDFARMLQIYWLDMTGDTPLAAQVLDSVADPGLRFAAEEYRGRRDTLAFWAPHDRRDTEARDAELIATLIDLHTGKDVQYGDSWKKRGEFASVVNNIARKADRLARWNSSALPTPELIDTLADLTIYACKYALYLYEFQPGRATSDLRIEEPAHVSDGPAGVSALLTTLGRDWLTAAQYDVAATAVLRDFDAVLNVFEEGHPTVPSTDRLDLALALAADSLQLLGDTTKRHRSVFLTWRAQAFASVAPSIFDEEAGQ